MNRLVVLSAISLALAIMWLSHQENKQLRQENHRLEVTLNKAITEIKQRDTMLINSYNSVKRIQIYLGTDTLYDFIRYKDLLRVSPKAIQRLNKADLRR